MILKERVSVFLLTSDDDAFIFKVEMDIFVSRNGVKYCSLIGFVICEERGTCSHK